MLLIKRLITQFMLHNKSYYFYVLTYYYSCWLLI